MSSRNSNLALSIALLSTIVALPTATLAMPSDPGATRIEVYGAPAHSREDAFRGVEPGMRADQVMALIGAPDHRSRFDATGTTTWDYAFRDPWGYQAEFSVLLGDDGVVRGAVTTRLDG